MRPSQLSPQRGDNLTEASGYQMTHHGSITVANGKLYRSDRFYVDIRSDFRAGVKEGKNRTQAGQRFYTDLKLAVKAAYGEEYLYVFGLDAPKAQTSMAIRQQLRGVGEKMADPRRIALLPDPKAGFQAIGIASTHAGILKSAEARESLRFFGFTPLRAFDTLI